MAGIDQLERPFFDTHTDELYELFVALGREEEWRKSPEALLPYTQEKWVGGEHGNSSEKDQFTPDQEAAGKAIMPLLGLQQEVVPPAGEYEQLVIVGGMMRVNRERIKFMKKLLDNGQIEAGRVVFWAGQRLRDDRDDVQVSAMDLKKLSTDKWVANQLARPAAIGWESRFATETELARLAYLDTFPNNKLDRVTTLAIPHSNVPGVPERSITSYTFTNGEYPEFTLMNYAAVERPTGDPRPTTDSSTAEWLRTLKPSENARVLIVAGNPHTLRNIQDIQRAAARHDREDIIFDVCGPAANPSASIQLYLGEVGRLLYMDAVARQEATVC